MAKRIFSLPRIDELTDDQKKAYRLPKYGQYMIVGSPGTGKSVVALHRTEKFFENKECFFLTFNHVLSTATKQLSTSDFDCQTAMSWFYDLYWKLVEGTYLNFDNMKMPERAPHKPDYEQVVEKYKDLKKDFNNHQLVIDEGQDLPEGWYDCLIELGFENFFVVADQNQQITEEHSSRKVLQALLGLEKKDVIELKENWRNTAPIAVFANYFFTDKSSPKPKLPDRPSADIPILFDYRTIDKISEMILGEYDRDPSKLIGLVVPTENKREWYARKLVNDQIARSNPQPVISTYHYSQKGKVNIDFSYGGIVVLNDKSVKGIEFDTVFIILDDFKMINNDIESLKKRFYVMASRAREKLFLFKNSKFDNIVDEILPGPVERSDKTGEEILKRRKI